MSEKPEDIPSCSPEYGTNSATTNTREQLASSHTPIEAIQATPDDA